MSKNQAVKKALLVAVSLSAAAAGVIPHASATGSHNGAANNNKSKVFNVKTYGAVGNGSTDDTAAIQAAITAAGSNTGNQVYFPSGVYLVSQNLVGTGLAFVGQTGPGFSASLLTRSNITVLSVSGTSPSVATLFFQVIGASANALRVSNATNININHVGVDQNFFAGIIAQNCTGGSISNNSLAQTTGPFGIVTSVCSGINIASNGFTAGSGAATNYAIADLDSQQDTIQSNTIMGLVGNTLSNGIISQSSSALTVANNSITGGNAGILLSATTQGTVSTNTMTNLSGVGFQSNGDSNMTVTKNNLTNVGAQAFTIQNSTGSYTVSNNSVNGAGTYGIQAQQGANIKITQNVLGNCGLSAATTAVIYVNQTHANSISITQNQYKGNTSNLTYFIDCVQPSSIATVSGNKTNTLLPTQVGP